MKQATGALLSLLNGLADTAGTPLYRQVYARIRGAILDGTFRTAQRLPSTRTLATDLGMSRITVESAFTQLQAEGFLVRRVGAGSFVAGVLPDYIRSPRRPGSRRSMPPVIARRQGEAALSARGRVIARTALAPEPCDPRPFIPCMPALDAFPHATWARLLARRARRHGAALSCYGSAAGYRPLREAVASYLSSARGVRCTWEQVVILTGAQQGLELSSRLLLDPGDVVWHEEPGYLGARAAFLAAGARITPVPVDGQGLDIRVGLTAAPGARLAYVTPSHQYPLGITMSLTRRLELLAWAERQDAWIIEDDYDSEFHYRGRPIAAVQGLDTSGRVIYLGSFNKVLFPSLRLAYLVAPVDLVENVVAARALSDGHPPLLSQAALTDFIGEGHFGAHLRQMRALYQERRDVLLDALSTFVGSRLRLGPADTGMHVATWLTGACTDEAIVALGATRGLGMRTLSCHYIGRSPSRGLVLGFSGSPPDQLRRAARTLAEVLDAADGSQRRQTRGAARR